MTLSEVLSWKVSDAIKSVPETVVYVLLEQFGGLCKSVFLLGVVPGVTVTPVGLPWVFICCVMFVERPFVLDG